MRSPSRRLRVLIYSAHVLPIYQPWTLQHATSLPNSDTALVGRRRATPQSIDVSGIPNFAIADRPFGKLEEAAYLITGRSPHLEAFIRDFKPDIIHAHFGPGGTEVLDVAKRLDIPLVVTYHGYDAKIPDRDRTPTLYERIHLSRRRELFRSAQLVLTVSDWLRDEVVALEAAAERTEVHYLGIDRDLLDGERGVEAPRLIAMVGRLVRFKGFHFAIDAFRLLRERVPGFTVEINGDGPERSSLEAMVAEYGLPVTFHGARSHKQTRDLLSRARVLCFPSTITENVQAEAFGLAVAEAQAMGVPVVAAATGGIPEALQDGATGFLVPDADPAALATALEALLVDDALHARMRAAGKQFVADRFDMHRNNARLEQRYLTLLDSLGRLP